MKKFVADFKAFCMRGNILDMAVGVMIGAAFGAIVNSLVNDLLMPLIGLLTGGINLSGLFVALDLKPYASIEAAKAAGVGTLNYGSFLQAVINFLLLALCVFLLVRVMAKIMRNGKKEEDQAKESRKCPFCLQEVADGATRCPHCTSEVGKA